MSFEASPATGHAFIGRHGLVQNLRSRVALGQSLAVIGGPKLGKTSLVRTALEGQTDRPIREWDLATHPVLPPEMVPGTLVVLDNLDRLAGKAIDQLLARLSAAGAGHMVVTGSRRLREWLAGTEHAGATTWRMFPLSVLLDRDMRQLAGPRMDSSLAAWTGNHPFLTKLLLHYGYDHDSDKAVAASRSHWEPFVTRLVEEIGEGSERTLLLYLIERGQPVNPTVAQSDTGIHDIKGVADTLTYLGVISRWIRQEEATLFAGCRLLNQYVAASGG